MIAFCEFFEKSVKMLILNIFCVYDIVFKFLKNV